MKYDHNPYSFPPFPSHTCMSNFMSFLFPSSLFLSPPSLPLSVFTTNQVQTGLPICAWGCGNPLEHGKPVCGHSFRKRTIFTPPAATEYQ